MTEIIIHGEDLHEAASQFKTASKDMLTSMKTLDDSVTGLEKKWAGATQQVFYTKYKDLHRSMQGISALMGNIARELDALADRMSSIDEEDKPQ